MSTIIGKFVPVGEPDDRKEFYVTTMHKPSSDYDWANEEGYKGVKESGELYHVFAKHWKFEPVWNGEGLPPVGLRVEYTCKKFSPSKEAIIPGNWYGGTIIAYYDDCVWTSDNGIRPLDNTLFRQIRTEAERKREEVAESLIRFLDSKTDIDNVFKTSDVMGFIDYVATGKIPGVELKK